MTLSDVDLAALAAVFNGILHDPGISVTGDYLACEVLAAASENEEDRKLIILHVRPGYDRQKSG